MGSNSGTDWYAYLEPDRKSHAGTIALSCDFDIKWALLEEHFEITSCLC